MIQNILDFISMDGNGFYIWISYFIPLTLFFSLVLVRKIKLNKILKKIKKNEL
ncbi:MAG: hypothetical protein CFH34_00215 [Alphaproteobacteria bacterium MarineAlpha9_Bin4]|nr:MAG: hypothetical protein CFH34_00215 [Alphaproteobacteria bacterium MarineAlpha9_Bin4]|tara:strand:+ start:624 stop:782 length:159 start_codon:yes stop_codon:yes gene_type:complete